MTESDEDVVVAATAEEDSDHSVSDAEQQYERDIEEDDDDDDDDDDGEEAVAAEVDDADDEAVEVVPVVVAPQAQGGAVVVVNDNHHHHDNVNDNDDDDDDDDDDPPILPRTPKFKTHKSSASTGKGKGSKKKRKIKSRRHSTGDADGISADRLTAADTAREMLLQTVPRLPVPINDSYFVRNFGQLRIEHDGINAFSTPNALYPVGFCCDRFEFSPVHGRVIKMRCSILDGRRTNLHYNGPIFRVMWGQGVDEDVDRVEYPYNPYANSAPITEGDDDVVAVPAGTDKVHGRQGVPVPGMRVKVRFDENQYYYGTIEKIQSPKQVDQEEENKERQDKNVEIVIRYDDGSTEEAEFPDPDICLVMPGNGDEVDANGNVELVYLDGKPVMTAIGRTPLEAWSNCLIKLGLVDEIILDAAMEAYKFGKDEELNEEGKKIDGRRQSRSIGTAEEAMEDKEGTDSNGDGAVIAVEETTREDDREPVSAEEKQLRDQVTALQKEMAVLKQADETAMVDLADARIKLLGRLLCNPFGISETAKAHQASWMAAAVRKEKTKMGSTGNKRKIVTATDLLERNNTFYNAEVEALLEGLPGSEYCIAYQYQANRGAMSASRQWLQEQRLIHERETKRRMKLSKEVQVKASLNEEKEIKRKRREHERDARKRQKQEEEEDKKKTRIEERLSRLKTHIEERLFKEASFQREKVVLLLSKNLNKEFSRRRKAAEMLSRERIEDSFQRKTPAVNIQDLPALAKQYDEDIVRIWDFISTFGDFFLSREYMKKLPSIDDLQIAIDTLRGSSTKMNKAEATTFVTELAVSLCKPLSAGITRMLFASLIALNPALQKDFGAAFFNEVNATKAKEKDDKSAQSNVLLPVDTYTWKEIARIAFQSDALGELGFARHDAAHLLRGYRSAGHPNSKEARRLRRVEDFSIALLRQTLNEKQLESSGAAIATNSIRIEVPGSSVFDKNNWMFYLHNVKSMTEPLDQIILFDNLKKAIELAKTEQSGASEDLIKEMDAALNDISVNKDATTLKVAQKSVACVLDKATGEIFSQEYYGKTISKEENDFADKANLTALEKLLDSKLYRARMGELKKLRLTPKELKELTRIREEYMSDALQLKEEMKRQEMKEAGEGDDDDEDDDDEDDEDHGSNYKATKGEKATDAELIHDEQTKSDDVSPKTASNEGDKSSSKSDTETNADPSDNGEQKIGKETQHDEFCGDIPNAPELIRRCLAVLRTLSQTGPAEPFIFPVDPQTNPGYYDMLLQPMCMREVGLRLQQAAKKYEEIDSNDKENFLETTVAQFARNVRLIGRNCLSYANAGPMIISAGGEMLRIFERLLLDWVLAPDEFLTPLNSLDDDLCVEPHPTDLEATVLLCDGCEGNFNVSRLDPPLLDIPKGDWYCPRCLTGRWWGDLDPRIGKQIKHKGFGSESACIKKCLFVHREQEESPSLMYEVEMESGDIERLTLEEIDEALREAGTPVPRIRCLEAVAESKGYGAGIDHGLRHDLVPVLLNPKVSDAASQVMLSSSVFRDSVAAASTLLINDPQEMTASEWLRLLALLIMKCSSSDIMQNVASEMEEHAAERLAKRLEAISRITEISQVLPRLSDEPNDSLDDEMAMEIQVSMGYGSGGFTKTESTGEIKALGVPSSDNLGKAPMVVEATAVEVPSMQVDSIPSQAHVAFVEAEAGLSDDDEFKSRRAAVLAEKSRRQKAREDSIAAFCIKNQLRSTVASFEYDNVSHVVESTLVTDDPGLAFSATRCRGTCCDFCTLADTSLGANFVRIPNADEWDELIKYGAKSRKTNLVAELSGVAFDKVGSAPRSRGNKKLVKVSLRIGDELVADEKSHLDFDQIPDGGMLEFLPRNPDAFQHELKFRYESGLPFITGSLTGHECCAVAAHNARKVKVVQDYKDRQTALAELEEGNTCGRTLEIGRDQAGRSYWSFNSDPDSLFVCLGSSKWYKYSEPETIASVIISLGKDPVLRDLKRAFPKANEVLKNGSWTDLLLKRHFKLKAIKSQADDSSTAMDMDSDGEGNDVYEEKENVLVESKDGTQLWDAKVQGVAKNAAGKVTGYRVHYDGWSSRFDEWVSSDRVVEANENNKKIQESMRKDAALSRDGLPPALENMEAISFLYAKDRARGSAPLPDFGKIAHVAPNATEDEKIFATMKAALLAIEAALPVGSVNNTENGDWSPEFSNQWRIMVQRAEGPWNLMRCVILLEDIVSEEWMKEQIGHLRSCLPSRWKALDEACPSSLALRIFLLDRGIMYATVDKRKFKPSNKSRK